MTEEEYADFTGRLEHYDISQAEFIRQAITRATIRPVVTISPVNDELLAAVGKLTAEYGKIGGNLNQIARALNEYGTPYNALLLCFLPLFRFSPTISTSKVLHHRTIRME